MSERVVGALRAAQRDGVPLNPHEASIWRLARAALQRDRERGWNLVVHPARLRIQTIDALCTALMRQAPITAKLGAVPLIVEHAEDLYATAAREELFAARADDPAWSRLLEHLDNDAERVVGQLATMLSRRDQWLRHLVIGDTGRIRSALEAVLAKEIEAQLEIVCSLFPDNVVDRLAKLARYAATNLDGECAQVLARCGKKNGLLPVTADELGSWHVVANWLLTRQGHFRKQVDAEQGFPPRGDVFDLEGPERGKNKQAMQNLLKEELAAVPGLCAALEAVRCLPSPRYDEAAWDFLWALLQLLPRTVARLRAVFARERQIDFAEATLVALEALGRADAPSDLLLSLDLRVEHLLVDEFQDTSFAQCELIERVTAGWTQGDGRSLFVVGDPMQSIYRFREAEVRLFIEAQREHRIGGVGVEPLTLSRNFRSQRGLVEWVNRVFPQVLPPRDDPVRSAVSFRPSTLTGGASEGLAVTVDLCLHSNDETRLVVDHVRSALKAVDGAIAILVRKRADLNEILPALRDERIPYAAVDIDLLSQRQAILDLASLTHALIQPDDRLAWLSALRAPWCGLTLPDLLLVSKAAEPFPDIVSRAAKLSALSSDGQSRLSRFSDAIGPVLAQRGRVPLITMVRGAWIALGGPACTSEAIDLDAADRFFTLLGRHARGSDLPDWETFTRSLDVLYAAPEATGTARVQIMTLHKAKGLEFDVVIMPGLTRQSKERDEDLLLWRERPAGLLIAPVRARSPGTSEDRIYRYLCRLADDETRAELGRLIYVGCTRAKQRLHLTAVCAVDATFGDRWAKPRGKTALGALWPAMESEIVTPPQKVPPPLALAAKGTATLSRLPLSWRLPDSPEPLPGVIANEPRTDSMPIVFDWARETARQVGIVAHGLLLRIANDGLAAWDERRVGEQEMRIEREFALRGCTASEARAATAQVIGAIVRTIGDPRGRWLFDPRHSEARSECALTGMCGDVLTHVIVDRTFVDSHGVRWIVDFKLSRHEGADVEAFLDSEKERYRDQLENYGRVVQGMEESPLRLALYFPLLSGWREWKARS